VPKEGIFDDLLCQGRRAAIPAILNRSANGGHVKAPVLAEIHILGRNNGQLKRV